MTQVVVGIADLAVVAGQVTLVTLGLGSCVAIALYAAEQQVGGLAHVLVPHTTNAICPPGKVPSLAVPAMVARMRGLGVTGPIEARLVGGASMFGALLPPGSVGLGAHNVRAARDACLTAEVAVVAEITGGEVGRSVFFDVETGRVQVRTVWGDRVDV